MTRRVWVRGAMASAAVLLSVFAGGRVAARLFRVATLPPPTGRFAVASAAVNVNLLLAEHATTPVPVTLWYPTERDDAPCPLLLAFSGWLGRVVDVMPLAVEMASHGYVVAAIDDLGQISPHSPGDDGSMDFSSAAAYAETLRVADAKVARSTDLAQALLDALLAGTVAACPKLDGSRIGAFGFSFGGAVAAEAGARDRRIRAVVNLDGWLFGQAAAHGIGKPYLVISDANELPGAAAVAASPPPARYVGELDLADLSRQHAHLAKDGGCVVAVAGTEHENFSGAAYRRSLRGPELGPIDPPRATQIVRAYAVAFFGAILADGPDFSVALPAIHFPEARVQCWPTPGRAAAPATPFAAPR